MRSLVRNQVGGSFLSVFIACTIEKYFGNI